MHEQSIEIHALAATLGQEAREKILLAMPTFDRAILDRMTRGQQIELAANLPPVSATLPIADLDDKCRCGKPAIKTDSYGVPECSRCARKAGPPIQGKSVPAGRNDLCTCGSGRKFKKCCRIPARMGA